MTAYRFIIVDDDELDIRLAKLYIKQTLTNAEVVAFSVPEEALKYFMSSFGDLPALPSILLLDLNMPSISGWEFLEIFEQLDQKVKNHISVYILSSSVDSRDIDKASNHHNVKGYLQKPITVDSLKKIGKSDGLTFA
ncbi:MAG: response regulator [Bacteroidetes bacterium]|nr:MAG: response regulator [Bacteroidota bacterium]